MSRFDPYSQGEHDSMREKLQGLATYLRGMSATDHDDATKANYMADAIDIIQVCPWLLGLGERRAFIDQYGAEGGLKWV
jgi:hypothetical protein